jgi:hypothetical protein
MRKPSASKRKVKPKRKISYPGDLATPMKVRFPPWLPTPTPDNALFRVIAPPSKSEQEEYDQELKAARASLEEKLNHKLKLLLDHYQITEANPWRRLALALASDHVPGFAIKSGKVQGRRKVWTPMKLVELKVAIEDVMSRLSLTVRQACKYIANNKEYCEAWGRKNTAGRTDERWIETLESRYYDSRRLSDADWKAYLRRKRR